jgi:hypothetical protein
MQLFRRRQRGVQFILQFRCGQLALARMSKRYGGHRELRPVRLARSVHARVKYCAMFMNLLLYEETIDRPSSRTNHIHFAVELHEVAIPLLAGDISGEEPLIANGRECQRVIVPVAGKDGFALHFKATGFATRYYTPIVTDDSNLRAEGG